MMKKHLLCEGLERRCVDGAADVDVDGGCVPGGGRHAGDAGDLVVVVDGARPWGRRRRRVGHRGGCCW